MRRRRASNAASWSLVASFWSRSAWRDSLFEFWLDNSRRRVLLAWLMSWRRVLRSTNCSVIARESDPALLTWSGPMFVERSIMGCCWLPPGGDPEPESMDRRMNLKISNASGFSGVAAVMPKVFPAGNATYAVR